MSLVIKPILLMTILVIQVTLLVLTLFPADDKIRDENSSDDIPIDDNINIISKKS